MKGERKRRERERDAQGEEGAEGDAKEGGGEGEYG